MSRQPARAGNTPQPWRAKWCWPRMHESRPWNRYVYFRKLVELPDRPRQALVRVSADARYTLYVNGQRVHMGPARCFPEFQSYDTLDLAPFLQAGPNAICAIVHQFGVPTWQSVYRGACGFVLDGEIDAGGQAIALHTPDGWVCRDSSAWRRDVVRLSIQMGFQEHFDADADPIGWMGTAYVPSEADGWTVPFVHGPVGTHPWLAMEERGVPLLADTVKPFVSVIAQFSGENARGYKVAEDVYRLAINETRKRDKSPIEGAGNMLRDDGEATTIAPPPDGHHLALVLDLGQERTGHIMLDIAEAAGDEIIDILYTEDIDKSGGPLLVGGPKPRGCEEATADRYRCRSGPQKWEPFHYKGFRYATLVFRNVARPLKVRFVGLRQVQAAVEDLGAFECSEERLNRIWQVGRETLRNCMFDAYVDCPWREQAQWWGDARVQFKVCAYAFGDVTLLERGIRQVAQSQAADGALHAHPPSDARNAYLPDYMMTWVGTLWEHYFHTGDPRLARQCLPVMHRLFEFFAAHENPQGLIGGFDGFWVFLDWQELYKQDFSGVLNLMYLQALRWAAALCQVLEEEKDAARYNDKATALADVIEKRFWDPKARAWRDGWDPATGNRVEQTSQHMNALAILLHVKPETNPGVAKDILLKPALAKRSKVLTASPFFYAYVLDALGEANFRAEIIQIIRERWGQMIEAGATTFWEGWERKGSLCHAWSASPVYHLSQQVLGVMPVNVGWRQVRIAPLPAGLDFARGVVPSPLGPIRVEWEKVAEDQLAVRIELPAGMEAEFVDPLGEIRTLDAGVHQFQA